MINLVRQTHGLKMFSNLQKLLLRSVSGFGDKFVWFIPGKPAENFVHFMLRAPRFVILPMQCFAKVLKT